MTPEPSTSSANILTALLRHFDWSPTSRVPGRYEAWTLEDSDEEIIVPLDPERLDYGLLLERAQRSLFAEYGREARELSAVLELRTSAVLDSTHWQKETALEAGMIGVAGRAE
jgi:hypothetical protein